MHQKQFRTLAIRIGKLRRAHAQASTAYSGGHAQLAVDRLQQLRTASEQLAAEVEALMLAIEEEHDLAPDEPEGAPDSDGTLAPIVDLSAFSRSLP